MPHHRLAFPFSAGKNVIVVFAVYAKPGHLGLVLHDIRFVMQRSRGRAGAHGKPMPSNLHTSRFRAAVNSYLERPIETFEVR